MSSCALRATLASRQCTTRQAIPYDAEFDGAELDAINNVGRRQQKSFGTSLQLVFGSDLGAGRRNDFTVGMGFSDGKTSFGSVLEVAQPAREPGHVAYRNFRRRIPHAGGQRR